MATEPITHFTDRADAVSAALRMTGARPTATEAMARVDEKITDALSMFDARTAARDLAEFTEAGRTWAKNPTKGGLDRLIEALAAPIGNDTTTVPVRVKNEWGEQWQNSTASTPEARRIAAARKGALAGARPPDSRHGGYDQEADFRITGQRFSNTAGARYLHQECRRTVL